jgi:uncharacterized membrane protein HdeD (DUF308 family)
MPETLTADRRGRAAAEGPGNLLKWPGWSYLPGAAFVAIGIVALLEPPVASVAALFYIGAMLLVGGFFMFLGAIVNLKHRGSWIASVIGLLTFATGLIFISDPTTSAARLIWVMAGWLIVGGLAELAIGFRLPIGRGWLILVSFANIALGLLMVMIQFSMAFAFLGYVVGASMVIQGAWSLAFTADLNAALRRPNALTGSAG